MLCLKKKNFLPALESPAPETLSNSSRTTNTQMTKVLKSMKHNDNCILSLKSLCWCLLRSFLGLTFHYFPRWIVLQESKLDQIKSVQESFVFRKQFEIERYSLHQKSAWLHIISYREWAVTHIPLPPPVLVLKKIQKKPHWAPKNLSFTLLTRN